jgi:cell division protein FtsZ
MDAFRSADEVLLSGVQGITDLITTPGLINLDFADVKSVMSGAGSALMGIGSARGEGRAVQAAQKAINSPLLEASMEGAHGVLLSIAGGSDLGLFEINESASLVQEAAHPDANIIFGTVIDDSLGDEVRVTVIAAGFDGGGPTHKKLEPTALSSPPRTASGPIASATAAPAPAPAPQPQPQPVAQTHTPPPVVQTPPPVPQPTPQPAPPVTPPPTTVPPQPSPVQGNGYVPSVPRSLSQNGSLPSRPVPVTDDPDDEVDVPPFMRR